MTKLFPLSCHVLILLLIASRKEFSIWRATESEVLSDIVVCRKEGNNRSIGTPVFDNARSSGRRGEESIRPSPNCVTALVTSAASGPAAAFCSSNLLLLRNRHPTPQIKISSIH